MSRSSKSDHQFVISTTSQMAFAVAICAFIAAGVGLIINQWLAGWMAVGGMTGVGLFYAAIGISNLWTETPLFEDDEFANASQRTARSENLRGEPISRPRLNPSTVPEPISGTQQIHRN